jgi:hypothetical protein
MLIPCMLRELVYGHSQSEFDHMIFNSVTSSSVEMKS